MLGPVGEGAQIEQSPRGAGCRGFTRLEVVRIDSTRHDSKLQAAVSTPENLRVILSADDVPGVPPSGLRFESVQFPEIEVTMEPFVTGEIVVENRIEFVMVLNNGHAGGGWEEFAQGAVRPNGRRRSSCRASLVRALGEELGNKTSVLVLAVTSA